MTLTEQHRKAQLALRALTLRQMLQLWPAFDVNHIADTWPAVQAGLVALIEARANNSAALAAAYYEAFRNQRRVPGVATPRLVTPSADDIVPSLVITGPATAGRLMYANRKDAAEITLTRVAGSVGRLTLNAGRDTLVASVREDSRAKGYQRVTSGNSCDYCDGRADTIFSGEEAVGFEAHDHCSCTAEPAY